MKFGKKTLDAIRKNIIDGIDEAKAQGVKLEYPDTFSIAGFKNGEKFREEHSMDVSRIKKRESR